MSQTDSSHVDFVSYLCGEAEVALRLGKRDDALCLLDSNRALVESWDIHSQARFLLCYGSALTIDAFSTDRTLDEALSTLIHTRKLAESLLNERLLADTFNALGEVYYVKGHKVSAGESDYPTGLRYFQQALALHEKLHDDYGLCRSLLNVGRMYQNLGEGETARAYFERARVIAEQQQRVDVQAEAIVHLASLDAETNSTLALQQATTALVLREHAGLRGALPYSHLIIAELHHVQGHIPQARAYYQRCYEVAKEIGMMQSIIPSLVGMGYIYLDAGEKQQALNKFEQAYTLSQSIGLKTGIEEATEALQEANKRV